VKCELINELLSFVSATMNINITIQQAVKSKVKKSGDAPKGKTKPAVQRKAPVPAAAAKAKAKAVSKPKPAKELCATKECKRQRMADNQYCAGCRCSAANASGQQCGNPKGVGESGRQRLKYCAFHS
jgi:hypothetical protein